MAQSLLDRIKESSRGSGPTCTIAKILSQLSAKDQADLQAAFADPTVTGAAIHRVLQQDGHNFAAQAVTRHRSGGCTCGRPR